MRIHNKVTIKTPSRTVTAFNAIEDAYVHIAAGRTWARYVGIGSIPIVWKRASISFYNADITKGRAEAVYTIKFERGEFNGFIDWIGLAPGEKMILSNRVRFTRVNVENEEVVVTINVYLDFSGSDAAFTGGENPLIKTLLGMNPLPKGYVALGHGKEGNYPIMVKENYEQTTPLTIVATQSELAFTFAPGEYNEAIIYLGDSPALRCNFDYLGMIERECTIPVANLEFFDDDAIEIQAKIGYVTEKIAVGLEEKFVQEYELGEAELIGEPDHNFMAVRSGNDFRVFTVNGLYPELVFSGRANGQIILLNDGSVADATANKLRLLKADGIIEYDIPDGEVMVLTKESGYLLFLYDGENLKQYSLNAVAELEKEVYIGQGYHLFRHNGSIICLQSQSNSIFRNADGMVNISFALTVPQDSMCADGCFFGNGSVGNYLSGDSYPCDEYSNEFFSYNGELYSVLPSIKKIATFTFPQVARVKDYIAVITQEGKLMFYRLATHGVKVFCATLPAEETYVGSYVAERSIKNATVKVIYD